MVDDVEIKQIDLIEKLNKIEVDFISNNLFLEALTELLKILPNHLQDSKVWLLTGLVYTRMAFWQHAISMLETGLKLNPKDNQAKQLLSLAFFSIGKKKEACLLIDEVTKSGSANSAQWMLRAYLRGYTYSDPLKTLRVAEEWGRRFADPLTRNALALMVKDRDPLKRLKVGYVTADFREHSVAFFMLPILENHNKKYVEIYVYSNGPSDATTESLKKPVDHWQDIRSMDDNDLCKKIRKDGIDILVDLSGFTHGHRLGAFARRCAPVQVTWLGYMLPLGMKAMDYRLISHSMAPTAHDKYYSEKLFRMSGVACYCPPTYAPLCAVPPMLSNGYPTLISLNSSGKITDEILEVWAEILNKRHDAKLIILVKEQDADAAQAHMLPRVKAAGMPLDRVAVLHQQPLENFMEMGYIADIALDTAPISGGTTTLHTIWMGLPIVTMDAVRGVDASTARILNGRLSPCGEVAKSKEEYVNAALNLMENVERLKEIRSISRELLKQSGRMNYAKRTLEIERSFRMLWLNYLLGENVLRSSSDDWKKVLERIE